MMPAVTKVHNDMIINCMPLQGCSSVIRGSPTTTIRSAGDIVNKMTSPALTNDCHSRSDVAMSGQGGLNKRRLTAASHKSLFRLATGGGSEVNTSCPKAFVWSSQASGYCTEFP